MVKRARLASRLALRTPTTRPPTSSGTDTADWMRPPLGTRLGNRERSSPSLSKTGLPVWATQPATPSPRRDRCCQASASPAGVGRGRDPQVVALHEHQGRFVGSQRVGGPVDDVAEQLVEGDLVRKEVQGQLLDPEDLVHRSSPWLAALGSGAEVPVGRRPAAQPR